MIRPFRAPMTIALAICAVVVGSAPSLAASEPKPPTNICINDVCSQTKAPTGAYIKWNPGHYTWLGGLDLTDGTMNSWFSKIDGFCSNANIKGIQIYTTWAALEPTPGSYSAAFIKLDKLMAKLASCKKKVMMGIDEREYGAVANAGTSPSPASYDWIYPPYLTRDSKYGTGALKGVVFQVDREWVSSMKSTPRLWDPVVMDRLIALVKALGARYNANPAVEQFYIETISMPDGPLNADGATYDQFYNQYKRLLGAASAAWPNTIVHTKADWVKNATYAKDFIAYCLSLPNCGMGQNDPEFPLPNVEGQKTYNGNLISTIFRGLEGGTDHRGKISWTSEVEQMGLGDRGYTYTPAQLYEFWMEHQQGQHILWLYNDYMGGTAQRWSTGILPFINSVKGKVYSTACPGRYASCKTD